MVKVEPNLPLKAPGMARLDRCNITVILPILSLNKNAISQEAPGRIQHNVVELEVVASMDVKLRMADFSLKGYYWSIQYITQYIHVTKQKGS